MSHDTHTQQEVRVNRNPIQKAFGSPDVKRHQVHRDRRKDRHVKHRDRFREDNCLCIGDAGSAF